MLNENPTQEFTTFQDMFTAAASAAATTFGVAVSGVLYKQGGRRFISTGLPVKVLLSLGRTDSATRKSDPAETRNRPLDQKHVKEIAQYLSNEDKYLVPPIILNSSRPLQIFAFNSGVETQLCVVVLPHGEYLYVTDGQHRLEALGQASVSRPEILDDAVGVTIIEEGDMDKIHQDFFDAAQAKPLAQALLVEYDGREPTNWLAKEVSTRSAVFQGRIERIGSVGKNSLMLFTNNQVKQGVLQLVVGDWSLYGGEMQKQAEQAINPAKDLWHSRLLAFFEEFTTANPQWNEVANRPLQSGVITNIPELRSNYLHFTGAGLLILCGVGHAILDSDIPSDDGLSDEQKQYVRKLAELDWSRSSALWAHYLVGPQGNISAGKNNIVLAVAYVKSALGLPVTGKEEKALFKAKDTIKAISAPQEQEAVLVQ